MERIFDDYHRYESARILGSFYLANLTQAILEGDIGICDGISLKTFLLLPHWARQRVEESQFGSSVRRDNV